VTNPYDFSLGGTDFLGTSGQTVDDLTLYTSIEDRLDVMEATLRWQHLAPSAPDTLGAPLRCPAAPSAQCQRRRQRDRYALSRPLRVEAKVRRAVSEHGPWLRVRGYVWRRRYLPPGEKSVGGNCNACAQRSQSTACAHRYPEQAPEVVK
jgi:hypothetical protein